MSPSSRSSLLPSGSAKCLLGPSERADDAVTTVFAGVDDAVMELEAVRQRRAIEDAAFDNIWRGQ